MPDHRLGNAASGPLFGFAYPGGFGHDKAKVTSRFPMPVSRPKFGYVAPKTTKTHARK